MSAYLVELNKAIKAAHNCHALHMGTAYVKEPLHGQVAWEGDVEVFAVVGHPVALTCYAWASKNGNESNTVTVLKIPPIVSPQTAVKAVLAARNKRPE